jgi:hypothetical protein
MSPKEKKEFNLLFFEILTVISITVVSTAILIMILC